MLYDRRAVALPGRSTLDRTIVRLLPAVPKPVVRRLLEPYIAGSAVDDAVRVVRALNAKDQLATIDVLGEEVSTAAEAHTIAGQYHEVLARIDNSRLESNISVKLTGFGLDVDLALCRANLLAIVEDAAARGNFVRIDMEDSSSTDRTLELYRELREAGHANVGPVLQACLRRTIDDADDLENVRLCKGIYEEPPEIAYRDFEAVRANYVRVLEKLVAQETYVGIATHDEYLLHEAQRIVAGISRDRYEFQMLLGVRSSRAQQLVAAGHRVRIYVPFGTQWYEYSLRRLQENPKIAGYIAADTVGRFLRRG